MMKINLNLRETIKNKLEVGLVIKNYKKMCELLGEAIKTSNAKTAQENEWKRYFDWEKEGQNYRITIIHKEPLPKTDGRDNNNIYSKYIEKLILDLLVQKYSSNVNNRRLYLSKDHMLQALNMVNNNYSFVKFNISQSASFLQVDRDNLDEFYSINNRNLLNTVERSLNRLSNKFLVNWQFAQTVAVREDVTVKNKYGQWITLNENHRNATQFERECIIYYEEKVATDKGFNNKQDIYLSGRYQEFTKEVCTYLQEDGLNILYYYKSFDIVFHPNVEKELKKINQFLLEYEERQDAKITLNGIISNQIIKNAEKRHEKSKSEIQPSIGQPREIGRNYKEQENIRRSDTDYVTETNKIVDTVINDQANDLSYNINNYSKAMKKKYDKQIDDLLCGTSL